MREGEDDGQSFYLWRTKIGGIFSSCLPTPHAQWAVNGQEESSNGFVDFLADFW